MRNGTGECGRNENPHDAQQHDPESPMAPWRLTLIICLFDGRWSHREHVRYWPLGNVATGWGDMVGAVGIEPTTSPV
jgi:hypothetical protein